jgi:hypothetical protein
MPGAVATYSFAITPDSTSFGGTVTFTVKGLPAWATYTFSPSTLSPTGGAQLVLLNVQSPAVTALTNIPPRRGPMEPDLPWFDLPWFALILLPTLGSRVVRRKLDARLLAAILLVTGIGGGLLMGCGLELHPATYTLTVTAASGPLQHTQTVTLTLQ